ncbi:MAG TPA: hypothetical protein VKI65_11985, partial [Gemmataceae bacterium]|nr:hypothetical protein [Gemmataceae bacterium]
PQSYCTSIAFSPDSKVLAAGRLNAYSGKDGKSRRAFLLWEVDTGKELRGLAGEELQVRSVAFSPDGKILASGNDDKTVQFWEVSSGRELRRLNAGGRSGLSPDVLRQLGRGVFIVFSADGKTLVSACDDRTVLLWDVNTGKEVRELPAEFHPDCMALSRHGLLTGAGGTAIRLLDVATGKAPPRPEGHLGTVSSLGFSPDGKMIASASSDIRLWEAATGREIRRLPGRATVAFSPDGSKLVCGGADYTLRLHETATGRELRRFPASRQGLTHPTAVAFSPDGKLLASESSRIVGLWEVDTGKEVPVIGRDELNKAFNYLRPQVDSLAYSPDGKTIAWASAHKELCLFQVAPQKSYRKFDQMAVKSVAFSPDGKLLAAAAGRNVRHTRDFGISLWEVGTGREYRRFAEKLPELRAVAFSPDGKSVASGSRDGVLRLWEVTTARERHHFLGHCGPIYSIGFSRDGKSVASGSEDTTILVWDLRSEGDRGENTQLTTEQFEGHWSALAGDDAAKAYQAILKLAAAPGTSVPFLRKHLKPAVALDAKRIAQLVADLDDNQFAVREKAATGVRQLGEAAAPALRKALERKPSLELRRRAEAILDAIDKQILPPERLRVLRAIEVLEHIGTDGAKAVLKELAKGAPEDRLTEEAKLSLGRLEKRAASKP